MPRVDWASDQLLGTVYEPVVEYPDWNECSRSLLLGSFSIFARHFDFTGSFNLVDYHHKASCQDVVIFGICLNRTLQKSEAVSSRLRCLRFIHVWGSGPGEPRLVKLGDPLHLNLCKPSKGFLVW